MEEACKILSKSNQITTIGNVINKNDLIFERSIHTVVLLAAEHKDNVSPTSLYYDVNVQGIKNVTRAMDKAGIKYEKMIIEKETHGFSREENRIEKMKRISAFFNKYLDT